MSFALDIADWVAKTSENTDALVRSVVIGLGERIVERSPVGNPTLWKEGSAPPGYVGGRFRANWQHGHGTQPSGTFQDVDASGAVSINRIVASVKAAPGAGVHFLVNSLPYAEALENGHSSQAPRGMVGLAAIDFQAIVDSQVAGLPK